MIGARIEALSSNAFARFVRGLVLRISLGGWFEIYDLFMAAYISLGLVREGLFTATGTGLAAFASFVGAGFLGMFVGTLVFSWVSDRFGRRATFLWSLVFYSVMTALMAFAGSASAIEACRLLAGVGIGVQIITIDAYVSEIAPARDRGRLIAFSQFVSFTAVPVVALAAFLFVPHVVFGLAGWRIVALIGALGALIAWPIRSGLPESPRWLESRGRAAEADRVLARFDGAVDFSQPSPPVGAVGCSRPSWSELWRRPYAARTAMLVVFNALQPIGYYGFVNWVPLLLAREGVAFVRDLQYALIIAIANPFGPLIAMAAAEAAQRKWQIVWLAVAIAGLGLAFAGLRAPFAIVGIGSLITLAINWFSSAFHAYQAELFPTRIRAIAVGFVYSWSRLCSIFVSYWIALALVRYGVNGVFALIAGSMVLAAAVIAAVGPRTNRVAVEALAP